MIEDPEGLLLSHPIQNTSCSFDGGQKERQESDMEMDGG